MVIVSGTRLAIEFIQYMLFEMLPWEFIRCFLIVIGVASIGTLPRLFGFTHGGD